MTKQGKKKAGLGVEVSPELNERFGDWAKSRGMTKSGAAEAAIELFMRLPYHVQGAAMAGDWLVIAWPPSCDDLPAGTAGSKNPRVPAVEDFVRSELGDGIPGSDEDREQPPGGQRREAGGERAG